MPEREVLGLQVRGSARIASYLRGRETTTYVRAGMTVRRWRETSFGPLLAWFVVLVAIAIGSRTYFDRGVPTVGEFLPFPVSPAELAARYTSAWDPRSFGVTSPVPTGWLALAVLSGLALFRMGLAMTLSVVGLYVVGAAGMWRLAAVYPANRSRIAAMVVYVATPLVPGVLATGRWSVLAWYAALPWMVYLLRRAVGIGTADPDTADDDLVDGIGPTPRRDRLRYMALSSLVLGLAAAFAPVTVVLWLVVGVVLSAGDAHRRRIPPNRRLVGRHDGGRHRRRRGAEPAVGDDVVVVRVGRTADRGPARRRPGRPGVARARRARVRRARDRLVHPGRRRASRSVGRGVSPGRFAAPRSCSCSARWRCSPIVTRCRSTRPEPGMMLVPVALGIALACASVTGAIGADVRGRGFGWRQPVAVLGNVAIVIGIVPALTSIGDGAWDAPRTPLPALLGAQLPLDPPEGDYRVLYIGDPRVLPVPAREYRDGIAFAVVDDGPLDFTDRWAPPETDADQIVAMRSTASPTARRCAPARCSRPPGSASSCSPRSTAPSRRSTIPWPRPTGLIEALSEQLDISATYGPPTIRVFAIGPWIPVAAQLTGATADASHLAGDDVLVRADLTERTPLFVGSDPSEGATADVVAGVVHVAAPFDDRIRLRAGDVEVEPRPAFGVTTAFDIAEPATATLGYREPASRALWLALQAALWLAVFVVASRARSPFGRRRGELLSDETLIDLDELPPPSAFVPHRGRGARCRHGLATRRGTRVRRSCVGRARRVRHRAIAVPIDTAADDAELGRSLDELTGPS